MAKRISESRQAAYYIGMGISLIGLLMFGSVFVTGCMNFGDFSNFESDTKSSMFRAVLGMVLAVLGGVIQKVGARGLAGAGMILDPERARRELEPFSRQGGGMAKDALDEAGIDLGSRGEREQVIMIRCTACRQLNEEGSKFCQECGGVL